MHAQRRRCVDPKSSNSSNFNRFSVQSLVMTKRLQYIHAINHSQNCCVGDVVASSASLASVTSAIIKNCGICNRNASQMFRFFLFSNKWAKKWLQIENMFCNRQSAHTNTNTYIQWAQSECENSFQESPHSKMNRNGESDVFVPKLNGTYAGKGEAPKI